MKQDKKIPQKKEVPFIEILKEAGIIIWENKFLLWFGVLIALGSPGSFNIVNSKEWEGKSGAIRNFIEAHWQIFLIVALIFFAIGMALFLISLIGKAGLVRSVNLIAQNKKTTFRKEWEIGKKYAWKLFKLFLLFFSILIIIISVMALPIVFLILKGSWISAVLVSLLAVAIFIPLFFILALTNIFAEFHIILSDLHVWSAIETGYNLFLKNIKNSLIFTLLVLAVNIAAGLVLLPIIGIAFFILFPTGVIFYYMSKIAFGIFLVFAVLFFLAFILFVSSIFLTYKITAWTLFFREIAKVESEKTAKVPETQTEKEIATVVEKV